MSVKTLRFEPYPATAAEAKLPRTNWTGSMDIPEETDVRIEALPGRHVIYEGRVTSSISRNYQPGKYVYVMEKFLHAREEGVPGRSICTGGEFLVDVDEEQWAELRSAKPKMVKSLQTTDGPKLVCTAPGCNKKSDTRLAAFLHEAQAHFGIDPLKEPQKAVEVELRATSMKKQMATAQANATSGMPNDVRVPRS